MTAEQIPLFDQPHDPRYDHPAQFSWPILQVVTPTLSGWGLPVHDCFAGAGIRAGQLCDSLGLPFTGIEIEPEFIVDPRVVPGDATRARFYPTHEYALLTSPTYGNGMNDHFHARDDSTRHTYRQHLAKLVGHDRPLHPNNQGRYTTVRRGKREEAEYWRIAAEAVAHWPDHVIVNVSDYYNGGQRYPLVDKWRLLLIDHGYQVPPSIPVETQRQRFGANRERVEAEAVIVATRR